MDKSPGVRPIGIGEVVRRIVGKAVIFIIQPEVKRATGARQLCCGQQAGCEAPIHCMTEWFQRDENDGIILVDAQNAFNSLNRVKRF